MSAESKVAAPVGGVDVLAGLTPEQAHEQAPKDFSWNEAGAWMVGYNACADKHRAAVAELIEKSEAALHYMRLHKYADQAWADDLAAALARVQGGAA